jgi:hypothetical protein
MRLRALADEQARKKEQDLPSFAEPERVPLTAAEDKYYYEEPQQQMPGGLRRDGSVLNGVGVGYGRRSPRNGNQGYPAAKNGMYARTGTPGSVRPPASEYSYAGNAGVGAGGAGVERAPSQGRREQGYYDQQDPNQCTFVTRLLDFADKIDYSNGNAQGGYSDPYNPNQYPSSNDHSYTDHRPTQPYDYTNGPSASSIDATYMPTAYPPPQTYPPAPIPMPSTSYPNPHDNRTSRGPYDGYDDDENDPGALGAIGMMAQSNGGRQGGDYTGQGIVQPRPQHLADQRGTAEILRHTQSPMSPESDIGYQRGMIVGQQPQGYGQQQGYGQRSDEGHGGEAPPPSYMDGPSSRVVPEKAGYRPNQ